MAYNLICLSRLEVHRLYIKCFLCRSFDLLSFSFTTLNSWIDFVFVIIKNNKKNIYKLIDYLWFKIVKSKASIYQSPPLCSMTIPEKSLIFAAQISNSSHSETATLINHTLFWHDTNCKDTRRADIRSNLIYERYTQNQLSGWSIVNGLFPDCRFDWILVCFDCVL